MLKKVKKKLADRKLIRIIKPHTNKSKKINLHNFMKKDFIKIEKFAFDMQMLAVNAEKENLFGNVYAVAHAQVAKRPLAFFVLNTSNEKIGVRFKDFIDQFGYIIMNPEIVSGKHSSVAQPMPEGCLSFPGNEMTSVKRYYKATFKFNYLTFDKITNKVSGIKEGEYALKGFYAQLFQHSIDILNGKYIYDIVRR